MKLTNLFIEFTSYCNLRCKFCSLDDSRPKGYMSEETFITILDNIIKHKHDIDTINLYMAGETLLHPEFNNILSILSSYKKDNKDFPKISITTNGVFLDEEKIHSILECVDIIKISIDAGYKEGFEEIRRGAKWDDVLSNVENLIRIKDKEQSNIIIRILCLQYDWLKAEKRFKLLTKKVEFQKSKLWDFIGTKDVGVKVKGNNNKRSCAKLDNTLVILWDGRVSTCCLDLNGEIIIGDINKSSLVEIYNCDKRLNMIKIMKEKGRQYVDSCKNCKV